MSDYKGLTEVKVVPFMNFQVSPMGHKLVTETTTVSPRLLNEALEEGWEIIEILSHHSSDVLNTLGGSTAYAALVGKRTPKEK